MGAPPAQSLWMEMHVIHIAGNVSRERAGQRLADGRVEDGHRFARKYRNARKLQAQRVQQRERADINLNVRAAGGDGDL